MKNKKWPSKLFKSEFSILICLLVVILVCIFSYFIFFNKPYYLFGDQVVSYKPFYTELIRLVNDFIEGGGLPFYSWNSFLGTDFIGSYSYYLIDIFIPILLLFDNVDIALMVESMLCIMISAISMQFFLKEFGIKKREVLILLPIVYSICGWANLMNGQYMFHRFFAFLPFVMFAIEYYLNKKNCMLYIIFLAITSSQCLYLLVPTVPFLVIYGVYTCLRRGMSIKDMSIAGCKFLFYSIISLCIIGIFLFPFINTVIDSPRVGVNSANSMFWHIRVYLGFLFSSITPLFSGTPNMFMYLANFSDSGYSLFIGIIPVIVLLKSLFDKNFKLERNVFYVLITLYAFTFTASMLHGFSEPSLRGGFVIIIFAILIIAIYLDEYGFDFKIKIQYVVIYIFVILILLLIFVMCNFLYFDMKHFIHLIIYLAIFFMISWIYNINSKLGIILTIVHLVIAFNLNMYSTARQYYSYDDTINSEVIGNMIKQDKDLLFRYYVDSKHLLPSHDLNLNQSLTSNFMSTLSYHSLYDSNLVPFLKNNNIFYHHLIIEDSRVMSMLGVKYYIVYDSDELPKDIEFEYAYNLNHLKVFLNKDYRGFGKTYDEIDYLENYNELNDYTHKLFIDDSSIDLTDYQSLDNSELTIIEKSNNYFKGQITLKNDNILMIPIPNNKGWKVMCNNNVVDTISVNGGFMGVPLKKGDNFLEFYFVTPGFKAGLIASCFGSFMLILMLFSMLVKKRGNYVKN